MNEEYQSCGCSVSKNINKHERRILITVLVLNGGMFFAEFGAGLLSNSTALLADSLDMLADALVYAIGLYALGRPQFWRNRAALTNGILQLTLGMGILVEVIFKLSRDVMPQSEIMGLFAVLALIVNTISLVLLTRFREGDINLRATWICSRNDMLANIGVLIAAGLVAYTQTGWPDIIVGLIIAAIVIYSAIKIINEAKTGLTRG
ncbi:Cobalt-zinc-cadmium resistance protein CzcD [hydrothermal vent metagenome]|uniref:Cobalt-zinc-cadmium resistance protein CzcD n=1 Tax=hydrothermal vent metagenome TaxID=652676 RepID=A0A3B1B0D1_9ZZZZ